MPMLVGSRFFHFFIYFGETPSYIRGYSNFKVGDLV